jgi:hypothetical protein
VVALIDREDWAPRRLDIACGQRKRDGYTGIDRDPSADIVHDLFTYPWPIRAGSVREVNISHFVEHIPHHMEGWDRDGWWLFWDEVHRITRRGAKVDIVHPYVMSARAFWDPEHVRFIHEATWYYLDAEWRKAQLLDHYPTIADFEVVVIEGMGVPADIQTRNADAQDFARARYWNVLADLRVELKRR